ncbi:unnamed protein product [Hydatigera taeniaeformis]|uniref:PRP1_N domain-containing protein n=1 Tax=Hydatigena taeniaeformis TaxID=6205 RepID=A0A0R3X8J6_HYDTA|nr:unnamed protein product [Hydatigera taeniaeformis]
MANDSDEPDSANQSWLATQLRQAKQMRLRKQQEKQEGGGFVNSTTGSLGIHAVASAGTLSRTQGADMMSDLQRVLAARRRAREGDNDNTDGTATDAANGASASSGSANSTAESSHLRRPSQSINNSSSGNAAPTFAVPTAPAPTSNYATM